MKKDIFIKTDETYITDYGAVGYYYEIATKNFGKKD
jgi:hypothetical protein